MGREMHLGKEVIDIDWRICLFWVSSTSCLCHCNCCSSADSQLLCCRSNKSNKWNSKSNGKSTCFHSSFSLTDHSDSLFVTYIIWRFSTHSYHTHTWSAAVAVTDFLVQGQDPVNMWLDMQYEMRNQMVESFCWTCSHLERQKQLEKMISGLQVNCLQVHSLSRLVYTTLWCRTCHEMVNANFEHLQRKVLNKTDGGDRDPTSMRAELVDYTFRTLESWKGYDIIKDCLGKWFIWLGMHTIKLSKLIQESKNTPIIKII